MRLAKYAIPPVAVLLASFAVAGVQPRRAQGVAVADSVIAINPPATPLPAEAASAGVTKFSFIAYGDTRGPRDATQPGPNHQIVVDAMLAKIKELSAGPDPVRFVLHSGDAVLEGRNATMLNVGFVPLINRITGEGGVPFFQSAGNHDVTDATTVGTARRDSGLTNFLRTNARLLPPKGSPRRLDGYPTYAFGFGNTFVLAFDSNIPDDSVQFAWVKAQLNGLDRRRYQNIVVFTHVPPFSSGPHQRERQAPILRERYMPLFRQQHVRVLLAGHEHFYEHWIERYRDQSGVHRLDEIVSAGGGAPHYVYTGEPDLSAYLASNARDSVTLEHIVKPLAPAAANPFHFLVVHVDGARITVDVVSVEPSKPFAPYPGLSVVLADSSRARPR
jgi:hypothetical protein